MRVLFIDEKGNTYKALHPPTGDAVIGVEIPTGLGGRDLSPVLAVIVAGHEPYYLPNDHSVRVLDTVGQAPVEG